MSALQASAGRLDGAANRQLAWPQDCGSRESYQRRATEEPLPESHFNRRLMRLVSSVVEANLHLHRGLQASAQLVLQVEVLVLLLVECAMVLLQASLVRRQSLLGESLEHRWQAVLDISTL